MIGFQYFSLFESHTKNSIQKWKKIDNDGVYDKMEFNRTPK